MRSHKAISNCGTAHTCAAKASYRYIYKFIYNVFKRENPFFTGPPLEKFNGDQELTCKKGARKAWLFVLLFVFDSFYECPMQFDVGYWEKPPNQIDCVFIETIPCNFIRNKVKKFNKASQFAKLWSPCRGPPSVSMQHFPQPYLQTKRR